MNHIVEAGRIGRGLQRRVPSTLLLVTLGLLLVPTAGCQSTQQFGAVEYESAPWGFARARGYKLTTEHYEIHTTIKDQVLLDALPSFIEAAYENYRRVLPATHAPAGRMKIYLFATRGQWEAFTKRLTGARAPLFLKVRNGGYSERGVVVIEYVAHSITFPLFAHEGFHQYLHHHVNKRIPSWLNEGLAVYCEGQRWGSDRVKKFEPDYNPKRRNDLAAALTSNQLHSLRKLLETNPGQVIGGSSRKVATYYAQVWALIVFLHEGADGKYAADFQRLLDQLDSPELEQHARAAHIWSERSRFDFGTALFRSFISEDLDTVEQEYFDFMRDRFLK